MGIEEWLLNSKYEGSTMYKHKHRLIIAGGRDFKDWDRLKRKIDKATQSYSKADIAIVSGGTNGADRLAERYAAENDYVLAIFEARWEKYGKSAGTIRNRAMAEVGTELFVFWDGKCTETKNMIDEARKRGINVNIYLY